MGKLLVKLLVIGIVVSLAWNAALSWAVFRTLEQPNTRPLSSDNSRDASRDFQLNQLIADATRASDRSRLR